jgi:callose synthase
MLLMDTTDSSVILGSVHFFLNPCHYFYLCCLWRSDVKETAKIFSVFMQMTVLTLYAFLYGKAYLALSGVDASLRSSSNVLESTALQATLNTQFLFQIGIFTAVPMIVNLILEEGILRAIISFCAMQLQLASVFFTFSLGTRTHYFGRTVLHGGAKYRSTGRGFVVRHIKFAENYRQYSRSHFTKA